MRQSETLPFIILQFTIVHPQFILIVSMWATKLLANTLRTSSFTSLQHVSRNFYSISTPPVNDCVFMQSKIQSLVPNFFLHNIRELLEKMSMGNEVAGLAELFELNLVNQSKLLCRVILSKDDSQYRIGNQFRTDTN